MSGALAWEWAGSGGNLLPPRSFSASSPEGFLGLGATQIRATKIPLCVQQPQEGDP